MSENFPTPLQRLAGRYRIQTVYHDGQGRRRIPPPGTLLAILNRLGCPIEREEDADRFLENRSQEEGLLVPAAAVTLDERPVVLPLRAGRLHRGDRIRMELRTEEGERIAREWKLDDLARDEANRGILPVASSLPYGYHQVLVEAGGRTQDSLILSAPSSVFPPDRRFRERSWGLFLPLYAARSDRSWGTGDFTDLRNLLGRTRELGGELFGTLPLNACYLETPYAPSPYTPASRLFWNELFLDLEALPEFACCPAARSQVASPRFQEERAALYAASQVDYRRSIALKRSVLEPLAETFWNGGGCKEPAFLEFLRNDRYLADYAAFRAETERRGRPWKYWDVPPGSAPPATARDSKEARYHIYSQWAAHRQLSGLDGLYLDLPLGVHAEGFDTWVEPDLFGHGMSVGAPPDRFFTGGQNWLFPPLLPEPNRQDRYRYFRETVRRQCRFASLLRIDHVMGLHRQFWIPGGAEPEDGAYVGYPAEEYYAVLAIESHRERCAVVGEDLGTVPPGVREAMERHQVHRLFVGQFQVEPHRTGRPPAGSLAALNTHDLRPFLGFLRSRDIDDRVENGLLAAGEADREKRSRAQAVDRLARTLLEDRFLDAASPEAEDFPERCLDAWIRALGAGPARFVLVNLEDLWLEEEPQNIPGTDFDRPNWVQRAKLSLEEIFASDSIVKILRRLESTRRRKGKETL